MSLIQDNSLMLSKEWPTHSGSTSFDVLILSCLGKKFSPGLSSQISSQINKAYETDSPDQP